MNIPGGWAVAPLSDIGQLVGGGTPSTQHPEYWNGTIPWISSADIDEQHHISISRFISADAIENSATNVVPAGSLIIVTRVGLGKVALAPVPLCFSQDHQALLFCERHLNPKYLLLYLGSAVRAFRHIGRGTTISGVTKKDVAALQILVPPRQTQDRIVAEIEKQFTRLDDAVAALRRVQANLKRYRASVLKAACEGRLVPTEAELARKEGRDYEPASELLKRILAERRAKWESDELAKMVASGKPPKDNEWKKRYKEPEPPSTSGLPQLPEGWMWVRAEQVCDFITKGTTPAANKLFEHSGEIPYIKVYNLTADGNLDFTVKPTFISRESHEGELDRSRVLPGDVLMNIVGPPLGKVSIVPALYTEWNINQAVAIFRPLPGLRKEFLCNSLLCDDILRWALSQAKTTAGQSNLTLELCRDLPLPLPPESEQERIVVETERLFTSMNVATRTASTSEARTDRLRSSILSMAFSGKLVPQDPNDEPASVLLERIRAERAQEAASKPARKSRTKRDKAIAVEA